MDVVGEILARDRRSRDIALVTPDTRERTYRDVITNAYKSANVLRYLGARAGSTVAVDPAPGLHTTLAFLGAAGLGAPVRFDPRAGIERGDRVVIVAVGEEANAEPTPGTNLAVFGGPPERPETTHWEQELWSENPGMPPSTVGPDDPVVRTVDGGVTHRDLLGAAASTVERYGIDADTRVVLRSDFADPRALAAGVIAPLSVGGTAVLATSETDRLGAESRGELAVVVGDAAPEPPEPERVTLPALGDG